MSYEPEMTLDDVGNGVCDHCGQVFALVWGGNAVIGDEWWCNECIKRGMDAGMVSLMEGGSKTATELSLEQRTLAEAEACRRAAMDRGRRLREIAQRLRRIEIYQFIEWGNDVLKDDFYACIDMAEGNADA